jgi:hypothetical protein
MIKMFFPGCFLILMFSCASHEKKAGVEKDNYQKAKETLLETETKNPVRFLSVSIHDKKNLIGQTVIKGTITNHAKEAGYKDVDIELSFYSKTGVVLEKDNETIYESLSPGNNTDFKSKYFAPKGTDSVSAKVLTAKAVN